MTNLFRKKISGAATFLITTLLLLAVVMITVFGTQYGIWQQKVSANANQSLQAFEAAEAGLEYGINYLRTNRTAILAAPVNGLIQPYASLYTTNVTMANGSRYNIVYTNPVAYNYTLIEVTSTGTSSDGTSIRVVRQRVQFGSLLYSMPLSPIVARGNVSFNGSNIISNNQGPTSIASGGTVSLTGSAITSSQSGSSTAGHLGSDIQQNVAALTAGTANDFFAMYFGVNPNTVKNNANYVFSGQSNYSASLNGKSGTIWIDQPTGTANISGSVIIGSPSNPALVIINGNLSFSGSASIYGLVVVLGSTTVTVSGSTVINGGVMSAGGLTFNGSNVATYSQSILNTLQQSASNYYARVPGSWRDF